MIFSNPETFGNADDIRPIEDMKHSLTELLEQAVSQEDYEKQPK
jgi:hypothetical protein